MQIAVCDDNKMFLHEIREQLLSLSMADNISLFEEPGAFLLSVKNGQRYDAVLMDIDFKQDSTGMDGAEELYKLSPKTKIIYVTGNVEYSQYIFFQRANLGGFLTKPVDIQLLQANLKKVFDSALYDDEPTLMLKQGSTAIHIPLREICFIESKGHTIETHTTTGEVIISYERLANIMRSLTAGFYQCHKSYIVNMRQIRRFESNAIILKNNKLIPVSRSKYRETKEAYFSFIGCSF